MKAPRSASRVESLKHVDCDEEDVLQVTSVFQIKGYGEWPGSATISQIVDRQCNFDTTIAMFPRERSWNAANDRSVVCFKKL